MISSSSVDFIFYMFLLILLFVNIFVLPYLLFSYENTLPQLHAAWTPLNDHEIHNIQMNAPDRMNKISSIAHQRKETDKFKVNNNNIVKKNQNNTKAFLSERARRIRDAFHQREEADKLKAHNHNQNEGKEIETTTATTQSNQSIPHNLIFMYKHNILETKEPLNFYNNIQNTIQSYRTFWSGSHPNGGGDDTRITTNVLFLNDTDCANAIQKAEPKLVEHFWGAKVGSFMADICRIAVLYNEGGYYMDIDLKVIKPMNISSTTKFTSVWGQSRTDFFQAFIASKPHHPILRKALDIMLEIFEKKRRKLGNLGPTTLKEAYKEVSDADRNQGVRMFHELDLSHKKSEGLYPNLARQNGTGCCCNFIIHECDPSVTNNIYTTHEAYFFSRFVGKGPNCDEPTR